MRTLLLDGDFRYGNCWPPWNRNGNISAPGRFSLRELLTAVEQKWEHSCLTAISLWEMLTAVEQKWEYSCLTAIFHMITVDRPLFATCSLLFVLWFRSANVLFAKQYQMNMNMIFRPISLCNLWTFLSHTHSLSTNKISYLNNYI